MSFFSPVKGVIQSVKGWFGPGLATPETDPQQWLLGLMAAMPNPDPILRQMGMAEQAYASIMADAHVIGEVRSIRGSFRSHQWRIVAGDEDDAAAQQAAEVCTRWLQSSRPNAVSDWMEVMWQMASCLLTGYRVHEVVVDYVDGLWLPTQVVDRPSRRILFDANGAPLLTSRAHPLGEPVEADRFVISRHFASSANPYGIALLSSCFWPWTFKTGGWQYFFEYCKRHGLPWPVGRYPMGTGDKEIDALSEAMAAMLSSGYAVLQEGNGVELLIPNTSGGGAMPQERLIQLANREMSKALTSQAMVGEQIAGSRAASETSKDRQAEVHDSDRDMAATGMSQLFRLITRFNFGDKVAPPRLEFFRKSVAGLERAQVYELVANMGARPSREAMLEELDIPCAEDDDDALQPTAKPAPAPAAPVTGSDKADFSRRQSLDGVAGFTFARAAGMTEDEAIELATQAADRAIEDRLIAPVADMLASYEAQGKTLEQFSADFARLIGSDALDASQLREVIDRSLSYSLLAGRVTGAD